MPPIGRAKAKAEGCLRLSTKDLPARIGVPSLKEGNPVVVVRRLSSDRARVTIVQEGRRHLYPLDLAELPTPRGVQMMFICPLSGRRSRVLYWDGESLGCSKALNLAFTSQSQSPIRRAAVRKDRLVDAIQRPQLGKARRLRLIGQLQATVEMLSNSDEPHIEALIAIEDARTHERDRSRRDRRPVPVQSTKAALRAGRERSRYASDFIRADLDRMAKAAVLPTVSQTKALKVAPLDGFPELDIRELRSGQGRARAMRLIWPDDGGGRPLNVRLRIDAKRNRLLIHYFDRLGTSDEMQIVALAGGHRPGDRFMICPVSGERKLRLYYRAGRFAGRKPQQLLCPSQWNRTSGFRLSDPD